MSYGRLSQAPCGHDGEHIFGNYVKCLAGCDDARGAPKPVEAKAPEERTLNNITFTVKMTNYILDPTIDHGNGWYSTPVDLGNTTSRNPGESDDAFRERLKQEAAKDTDGDND